MKRVLVYIILSLLTMGDICAQQADSLFVYNDSVRMRKHPWRAAFENIMINTAIWTDNRFERKADYAKISLKSIRANIKRGFVWDNDLFASNQLLHPIHGSLFFSAARSNGLNYWESLPYSFVGSLAWEVCAETTPPSINDLLSTSFGGAALGEVSYRLSTLVLDDSKTGANRLWREFVGTVVSPVRGFNRIITGKAWKVRHKYYKYIDYEKIPVNIAVSLGDRYMADDNRFFRQNNNAYLEYQMNCGDILSNESSKPYDFFKFNVLFDLGGTQPIVSNVSLVAKLAAKCYEPLPGHKALIGLFQHFDYYNSEIVLKGSKSIPFKLAEGATFGLGMAYLFPATKKVTIWHRTYLNAVLLGGTLTDYYSLGRNYNLGSGFSIKNYTSIESRKYGSLDLNLFYYNLFTWKGYKSEDIKNTEDPYLYLNTQGDKGNTAFLIFNPDINLNLSSRLKATFASFLYYRKSHYDYHEDVTSSTFEIRLGLKYTFGLK